MVVGREEDYILAHYAFCFIVFWKGGFLVWECSVLSVGVVCRFHCLFGVIGGWDGMGWDGRSGKGRGYS